MTGEFNIAVHALVYLCHKDEVVPSEALAANICTNPARVRKVMSALSKAGLVVTREGAEGGYRFEGDPRAVSLRRIADALKVRFVSVGWHSGDSDLPCLIASGMAGLMDGIYDDLDQLCRDHLSRVTVADLMDRIFTG